jgi:glycosyltransferase involved in cell wall biosynthesis
MNNSQKVGQHYKLPLNKIYKRYAEGGLRFKKKYNNSKRPLITIITVTKNSEKFLEATIKSVTNQTNKNFEYILIDGGSTDNTLNIIKKYQNKINYWVSEDDKGIYSAFNKGLSLSQGGYIGFVNSDDKLKKKALSILGKYIRQYPDLDFFFGTVKKHWGVLHGYKPWKIFYSWGFYTSHSTGFYIKTESAKKIGYYNLKYKYSSDFDYLYRMIVKFKMKGMAVKKNELFGIFRRGGFSSKVRFIDHVMEDYRIRINNGQNVILILLIFFYKIIKNIKKII